MTIEDKKSTKNTIHIIENLSRSVTAPLSLRSHFWGSSSGGITGGEGVGHTPLVGSHGGVGEVGVPSPGIPVVAVV